MSRNKIALRYCGGCNPRYDRGLFVTRLMKRFAELDLEPYRAHETYRGVLVICGCTAQCARQNDLPLSTPRYLVSSNQEYADTEKFLKGVGK